MTAVAKTSVASFFEAAFEGFVAMAREHRTRHAQRAALRALLGMDPSRLDDLGITPQDVLEAFDANPPATRPLETRRAARATSWTAGPVVRA
jgi:uncharacterized protein YjiS (DUF1127 family)